MWPVFGCSWMLHDCNIMLIVKPSQFRTYIFFETFIQVGISQVIFLPVGWLLRVLWNFRTYIHLDVTWLFNTVEENVSQIFHANKYCSPLVKLIEPWRKHNWRGHSLNERADQRPRRPHGTPGLTSCSHLGTMPIRAALPASGPMYTDRQFPTWAFSLFGTTSGGKQHIFH